MKKAAILLSAALISAGSLHAQRSSDKAPLAIKPGLYQPEVTKKYHRYDRSTNIESVNSTTFWSEDFASGIPADWTQMGNISTSVWEYRGPSTSPGRNTGSRGAFAAGTGAIASPTANNGFLIFDSDYLDNGGNAANAGNGSSPAPHIGRLMTDTIDLTANTAVELGLTTYARQFFTDYYIVFSKDGGATWGDTIQLFDEVAVNAGTDDDLSLSFNVSNYIGGESEAMIQFVFAGNKPGNVNGTGYYFWQIDDLELRSLPDNELRFTDLNGAPAQDISFNSDPAHSKYGILSDDQSVDISFDANVYNYGAVTQTDVKLEVEIYDATGGLLSTLISPAGASLPMLDSLDFNTLTTPTWAAPAVGDYTFIYKITSDSLSASTTTATDTVNFSVSENSYAMDWGVADNFFGTASSNPDMIAAGTRYAFENEDSDSSGSGVVFIDGLDIFLSQLSDSTADIEIAIYDTAGFEFNAGFPAGTNPVYNQFYTLNDNLTGRISRFSFTESDSVFDGSNGSWTAVEKPLALPTGTYLFIVNFFTNATDGVVRIANSQQYNQPAGSAVFQAADGNWFGGFLNSQIFEAPFIRVAVADAPAFDISVSETDLNLFSVYPNPSNGSGNISFSAGGSYTLRVIDMAGVQHHSDDITVNQNEVRNFNFDHLKPGVYLMQIEGEGIAKTIKLQIR